MAKTTFDIRKEDKRPTEKLALRLPGALSDDLATWALMIESSKVHTVIGILEKACEMNRETLDRYKAEQQAKLAAVAKPGQDGAKPELARTQKVASAGA